jgi:hypothetical protein
MHKYTDPGLQGKGPNFKVVRVFASKNNFYLKIFGALQLYFNTGLLVFWEFCESTAI